MVACSYDRIIVGVVKSAQDAIEGKTKEKKLLGTWKVLELSQTVNLKVRALHYASVHRCVCAYTTQVLSQRSAHSRQHSAATSAAPRKNIERARVCFCVSSRSPPQQEIRHHQSMSAAGTPGTASPLGSTISRNEGSAISTLSNSHVIAGIDRWGVFQVRRVACLCCVCACVVLCVVCCVLCVVCCVRVCSCVVCAHAVCCMPLLFCVKIAPIAHLWLTSPCPAPRLAFAQHRSDQDGRQVQL